MSQNQVIRSFVNTLGIVHDVWFDQWQKQFNGAGSILSDFAYKKSEGSIQNIWSTWIDPNSYERGGNSINSLEFLILPDEIDAYISDNQTVFTALDNTCRQIVSDLSGLSISLESIEITKVEVSPITERLNLEAVIGNLPVKYQPKGELYYAIILPNIATVADIVELAKQRAIARNNPLNF